MWDITTGKTLHTLQSPSPSIFATAFSADGATLALGGMRGEISLWDAKAGKEFLRLEGPTSPVQSLAFTPDGRTLAAGYQDGVVRFWEVASGKIRRQWLANPHSYLSVAFSPNGKLFATGSMDTTVLVWDVLSDPMDGQSGPPGAKPIPALWRSLSAEDATEAFRAVVSLEAVPEQAVSFLEGHLRPAREVDGQRLVRLINALDSDEFTEREKATKEIKKLGQRAELALRRALAGRASPEMRRRVEGLLEKLPTPFAVQQTRQSLRAVEVLEWIDTPKARQLLSNLTEGVPEAPLTQEAKASLQRLVVRGPR